MKRLMFVLILLACFWGGIAQSAHAQDVPFMSLAEIAQRVAHGPVDAYFESVEQGTTLKRYDIQIRGIYSEPGLKVILFTTSTQIAAGMSGSPVYLDGKLVGALAYGFNNFTDVWWGGIAPIELMHGDYLHTASVKAAPVSYRQTFSYGGMKFSAIPLAYRTASYDPVPRKSNDPTDGMKRMVMERVTAYTQSTGTSSIRNPSHAASLLRAGMPIVVDLAEWRDEKGELTTLSALGTITYVDSQGHVYAFGHPFLNAKKVTYTFRTCEIIGIASSLKYSYKLGGALSDALGVIEVDSAYGVFGTQSLPSSAPLHNFQLSLKKEGVTLHSYTIRIGDNETLTPLFAEIAFGLIGETSGAPLPIEMNATEWSLAMDVEGYDPIRVQRISLSRRVTWGPMVFRIASYDVATDDILEDIYGPLSTSKYKFHIKNVDIAMNFTRRDIKEFRMATFHFPHQVIWRKNPILEVYFVSKDNTRVLKKRVEVAIDWSKIATPSYTKDTADGEKIREKIVAGNLFIYSNEFFYDMLSPQERETVHPQYFLGPDDFYKAFAHELSLSNKMIFAKVRVAARQYDESSEEQEDSVPELKIDAVENQGDMQNWQVLRGGLRAHIAKRQDKKVFYSPIPLPYAPSGSLFSAVYEEFNFEIVLDK